MARSKIKATNKPLDTAFRQQQLHSCSILLKPAYLVGTLAGLGIAFLVIGVLVVLAAQEVKEVTISYEDSSFSCCVANCSGEGERRDANPCLVNFTIDEDMGTPLYLYYRLTGFYANHKQFVRSRDDAQLHGKDGLKPGDLDCTYDKNFAVEGIEETVFGDYEVKTEYNTADNIISPCGLVSLAVFNDSYVVKRSMGAAERPGEKVVLDTKKIAWKTDRESKFKNAADGSTGQNFEPFRRWKQANCTNDTSVTLDPYFGSEAEQRAACVAAEASVTAPNHAGWCFQGSGYCVEDEHFMVWMRTAAVTTSRKIFGRFPSGLAAGEYTLEVTPALFGDSSGSLLYPVDPFDGTKEVVISTVSWLDGGKNSFLGLAYISVGAIFLLFAAAFLAKHSSAPRKLGRAPFVDKVA